MSRAWTEANLELDVTQCRLRQQRVREMMAERGIGRCVFAQREHVQYLTAFRSHRLLQAAVSLDEQGTCVLAAPGSIPDYHAADHVVTFECSTGRRFGRSNSRRQRRRWHRLSALPAKGTSEWSFRRRDRPY